MFIYNYITSLPEEFFLSRGLNNIKQVDFIQNPMTSLTRQSLGTMGTMKDGRLSIMLSEMIFLPSDLLRDLVELRELDMNVNYFFSLIPDGFFDGLHHLETVELSSNRIGLLSASLLCDVPMLQELYLDENLLSTDGIPPGTFCQSTSLQRLNMNYNSISTLTPMWFQGLTALQSLDITYNIIEGLSDGIFCDCESLKYINLDDNAITSEGTRGEPFCQLQSLTFLRLQRNQITYVESQWFAGLTYLHTLDLSHNDINFIHDSAFDDLSSVRVIDLQCNGLSAASFSNTAFDYAAPVTVELYGNMISEYEMPTACLAPGVICSLDPSTYC